MNTKTWEPSLLRVGLFFSAADLVFSVASDRRTTLWLPAQMFVAGAIFFAVTISLAREARVDVRFFPRGTAAFWADALKTIVRGGVGAAAIFGIEAVLVPRLGSGRAPDIMDLDRARAAIGAHPVSAWLMLAGWMLFLAASEEVFFRGIVLTRLRSRFGTVAAVIVSSVLFALVHWPPRAMPHVFVMGLLLAGIRVATDDLGASSLTHCFWDMAVLYVSIKK